MKSILISIQPKWCELIASGEKTIEVRKTAPKETPFKVYMYCTNPRHYVDKYHCFSYPESPLFQTENSGIKSTLERADGEYTYINGKVIGEFICHNSERFGCSSHDHKILSQQRKSCLTMDEIIDYCNGKDLYGWHISDLKIYDKPKELSEFIKPSKRGCCNIPLCGKGCPHFSRGCDAVGIEDDCYAEFDTDEFEPIFRPPQSWMYCEEVKQ